MVTGRSPFAWLLAAAAAGRLIVFLFLRQHWGWQPPYHMAYLQPPDWYEPSIREYLVPHMPLQWMTRYGQQFYRLGLLSAYLMLSAQRLSTRTENRP